MRPVYLAAAGMVVFWSSGFVGARLASEAGDWLGVLTWRFVVAAVVLSVLCAVLRVRIPRRALPGQLVVGLLSQVLYLSLVFWAVDQGVSSGTAALIASLQPLVVAVVAGPLLGERTSTSQRIGLLLGVAGVAMVVAHDVRTGGPAWAFALPVLAMLSLAAGTVTARRTRDAMPALASFTVQSVLTAAVYLLLSAARGQVAPAGGLDYWAAVAWLVVLSTFCGYGLYQYVVRTAGATTASTLLYLTPPTTMVWAWLMFGDPIGLLGLAGLVVCAVGVALALRRGAVATTS